MSWLGHLHLHYHHEAGRTTALDRHSGPLRVLQRLYPEGDAICHHVLVHPPGGLVGGDVLEVHAELEAGSHALITTPGATRFYRSNGQPAQQRMRLQLQPGTRLEWLPLETIAYRGCDAHNQLRCELAPGAEMMGWDLLALGLPAAGEAWDRGSYQQHLELPGVWLERARIDALDTPLLHSPLGWAGHRVLGTLWFAAGQPLRGPLREALLDSARAGLPVGPGETAHLAAGVTAPNEQVVVLRVLAPRVEAAMALLQATWAAWRQVAWALSACPPRVWRT
jgi:urease accessory protein